MRLYEFTLLEDRAEFVAANMKDRLELASKADLGQRLDSVEVVNRLKKIDPTAPLCKNIQFIANMYAKKQFKLEDAQRIRDSIARYFALRPQLPIKDLNQIQSLEQLYNLIEPDESAGPVLVDPALVAPSVRQQEKEIKQDVERIVDTPNFKVLVPLTEEASKLYGKGTKWCTAGIDNNRFHDYSKRGKLYIIIVNINGIAKKFQLHMESDQFVNDKDIPITQNEINELSCIPEYKKFLDYLLKVYYGKYFTK